MTAIPAASYIHVTADKFHGLVTIFMILPTSGVNRLDLFSWMVKLYRNKHLTDWKISIQSKPNNVLMPFKMTCIYVKIWKE